VRAALQVELEAAEPVRVYGGLHLGQQQRLAPPQQPPAVGPEHLPGHQQDQPGALLLAMMLLGQTRFSARSVTRSQRRQLRWPATSCQESRAGAAASPAVWLGRVALSCPGGGRPPGLVNRSSRRAVSASLSCQVCHQPYGNGRGCHCASGPVLAACAPHVLSFTG
jgi:hypothetical protein